MVRVGNFIAGLLNCCSLVAGLAAISLSVYMYVHGGSQCHKALASPLLVTGVVISAVSLLGFIGACGRFNSILLVYLTVLFVLIVALVIFTVFTFVVTNDNAGQRISNIGIDGHKTLDLRTWLQDHFVNGKNWNKIRSCLIASHACKNSTDDDDDFAVKPSDVFRMNLSPLRSGCCKPPSECGFKRQNGTFWTAPASGRASNNTDCKTWSNQEQKLCYDCNACKFGVLSNIKREWRNLAIFNACALALIIFSYLVACWARRNNSKDKNKDKKTFTRYCP